MFPPAPLACAVPVACLVALCREGSPRPAVAVIEWFSTLLPFLASLSCFPNSFYFRAFFSNLLSSFAFLVSFINLRSNFSDLLAIAPNSKTRLCLEGFLLAVLKGRATVQFFNSGGFLHPATPRLWAVGGSAGTGSPALAAPFLTFCLDLLP